MKAPPLHATSGDVRIAYETAGSRDPLLLIHGLGYDRHGWGPVFGGLAQDFRVVRFDNRGIGESDVPRGPYEIPQLAADALAVLDAVGLERAHVVGTSLGGMIAQELATTRPERVDRLVLVCTTPGGPKAHPLPERTLRLMAEFAGQPLERGLRRFVENALADETVERRPELVEEIYAYRQAHLPSLAGWQAQAAAALGFNGFDRLSDLRMPTLVLTGTADNVVDKRNSALLAERIPGARLELFPETGHLLFWEEPDRFVRSVRDFLRAPA